MNNLIAKVIAEILTRLAKRLALPLLNAAVPRDLKHALPAIFAILDDGVPELVISAGPVAVTCKIADAIEKEVSRPATSDDIQTIIRLYSPIAAALRNSRIV